MICPPMANTYLFQLAFSTEDLHIGNHRDNFNRVMPTIIQDIIAQVKNSSIKEKSIEGRRVYLLQIPFNEKNDQKDQKINIEEIVDLFLEEPGINDPFAKEVVKQVSEWSSTLLEEESGSKAEVTKMIGKRVFFEYLQVTQPGSFIRYQSALSK